ncbi:MAG: DUF433 domain-containing protein [Planctomycetes bacterium]|nr:DUF433 domain-containing protein [Planctomycetota bacterium]
MQQIAIIDRGRGPELAGTRITVFDIIPYLEAGHGPTYIAAVLNLSTEEVKALMQYIEDHKAEVMAENQKIEERIARGNPPEIEARLQDSPLHALIQARLAERLRQLSQEEENGSSTPGGP